MRRRRDIAITLLERPSHGRSDPGAYYIAVRDDQILTVTHGERTSQAQPTMRIFRDFPELSQDISDRRKATYALSTPGRIPESARDCLVRKIIGYYPNLDGLHPHWFDDKIVFRDTKDLAGPTDDKRGSRRPRANSRSFGNAWF